MFGIFGGKEIDDDLYEELEEALIAGDVGVETALEITERLRNRAKADKIKYAADLKEALAEEIADLLGSEPEPLNLVRGELNIILVVGVNGVGKTTSIGKIANLPFSVTRLSDETVPPFASRVIVYSLSVCASSRSSSAKAKKPSRSLDRPCP